MRKLACGVVMLVFAGALGMVDADELTPGSSPEQEAVPQEQAAAAAPPPAVAPFDAEQAKRHQEAWAKHLGVPVEVTNSVGMKLVLIPAGEFMMGSLESDKVALIGEKPQHRVRITKPFYLGAREVTQEQYEHVMGINPSHFSGGGKGADKVSHQDTRRFPVETVSWDDAVLFGDKLSAIPDERDARRTYRLPTEAEWEYACRAGTTTACHYGVFPHSGVFPPPILDSRLLSDHAWWGAFVISIHSAKRGRSASAIKMRTIGWCRDSSRDLYRILTSTAHLLTPF